jgi:hypothetical protein
VLVPRDLRTEAVADEGRDLGGRGMAPEGRLGEDHLVIEADLEAALRRREQVDRGDDRGPPLQQLVRQTDGPRDVVSGNAELDAEAVPGVHHRAPAYAPPQPL